MSSYQEAVEEIMTSTGVGRATVYKYAAARLARRDPYTQADSVHDATAAYFLELDADVWLAREDGDMLDPNFVRKHWLHFLARVESGAYDMRYALGLAGLELV